MQHSEQNEFLCEEQENYYCDDGQQVPFEINQSNISYKDIENE